MKQNNKHFGVENCDRFLELGNFENERAAD